MNYLLKSGVIIELVESISRDMNRTLHIYVYICMYVNYKVGMAVIKSTKTRVVVMVTNIKRHPYMYF